MLETEAKTKMCPVMTDGTFGTNGPVSCQGSACMAWEEWTKPVRDNVGTITGHQPKKPPQGHCGMIPPELNCDR